MIKKKNVYEWPYFLILVYEWPTFSDTHVYAYTQSGFSPDKGHDDGHL